MSSTDERVVQMTFDNARFKQAAVETRGALDGVESSIEKVGRNKGLLNVSNHMETVRVKASAMQIAVGTAIANISNRLVNAGINMAKGFTLDPIMQGFNEYELKMKSIQTILANTRGENLKTVTAALNELNDYADFTVYNFGQMTSAVGQLTTSGMQLSTATNTVKGFHNVVALAGADATQAAQSMVQMSQALQAGVIKAGDWISLSTRGLATQSLQKSLFETAKVAGTLKNVPLDTTFKEWSKAEGGFRNSLEKGWLTSEVFNKTMKVMTGDITSVKQLMKMGYSKKAAKDLLTTAQAALDAATKVRTATAFFDTLKEQIGSGWSQVFEIILGDFEESTELWTALSDKSGAILGGFFGYVTKMLTVWDQMGGRAKVFETLGNILAPIGALFTTIKNAWASAFPSNASGDGLYKLTERLELITSPLQLVAKLIRGLEAPLTIFFKIVGFIASTIFEAQNAVINFLKPLGEMASALDFDGSGILPFLVALAGSLADIGGQIKDLIAEGKGLKDIFTGIDFKLPKLSNPFKAVSNKPEVMQAGVGSGGLDIKAMGAAAYDKVGTGAEKAAARVEAVGQKIQSLWEGIKDVVGWIGQQMAKVDLADVIASINMAAITTFLLTFSRALNALSGGIGSLSGVGDLLDGVGEGIGAMGKAMQREALANLILKSAIAFGILAVSLWLLSKVPAGGLMKASAAMAAIATTISLMAKSLAASTALMQGAGSGVKLVTLGVTLIAFAAAIVILALAVKLLNGADITALVGVGVGMYAMVKALEALQTIDHAGLIKTAFALGIVGAALIVFAGAVKLFSMLDLAEFAEGLAYAAASLLVLTTALKGFSTSIVGAMAMLVVVVALTALIGVIKLFSLLDWGTFGKGMVMVAASLTVLTIALHGFQTSLAGAAAIVVVVSALYLLVGVIAAFALLDWGTFGKGLAMLTIAIVTLGALMALLGYFSPLILLGAAALLMFGAALALAGLGIVSIAKGLALMVLLGAGAAAAFAALGVAFAVAVGAFFQALALELPIIMDSILQMMQTLIDGIVAAVPMVLDGIKRLWVAILTELLGADKMSSMNKGGGEWLESLASGIKKYVPKVVKIAAELLIAFLGGLRDKAPQISATGVSLVAGLIEGIASRVGELAGKAASLIAAWLSAIASEAPKIADAGAKAVIDFINAMAEAIEANSGPMGEAMGNLGVAMVQGLINGVTGMVGSALGAIGDLAQGMVDKAKGLLKIFSPSRVFKSIGEFLVAGLTQGIQNNAANAIRAVGSMVQGQISIANEYISRYIQKLDQQTLAAQAKADGLVKAADKAQASAARQAKLAEKTKSDADNKKAEKAQAKADQLSARADRAQTKADTLEARAEAAKAKQDRQDEFKAADLFGKAQMRAEDAQSELDAAKADQRNAEASRQKAIALEKQAKSKDISARERKRLLAEAARARKDAEKQAKASNAHMEQARKYASASLVWQQRAGKEAADAFEKQYREAASRDAEQARFEKMTDAEKAENRRQEADRLQKESEQDLARAKKLAYTDLEAANALAEQALSKAEKARDYREEAERYGKNSSFNGVRLDASELAKQTAFAVDRSAKHLNETQLAMQREANTTSRVFNQYNYSPEALSEAEIYRQTNNLVSTS